jgi:hypothetical protein
VLFLRGAQILKLALEAPRLEKARFNRFDQEIVIAFDGAQNLEI